jgi:hypothetical protein
MAANYKKLTFSRILLMAAMPLQGCKFQQYVLQMLYIPWGNMLV